MEYSTASGEKKITRTDGIFKTQKENKITQNRWNIPLTVGE